MKRTAVFVLLCVFSLLSHAEVYKCVTNGKSTFSDQPCGDSATKVQVKPARGPEDQDEAGAAARSKALDKYVKDADQRIWQDKIDRLNNRIDQIRTECEKKAESLYAERRQTSTNPNYSYYKYAIDNKIRELKKDCDNRIKPLARELDILRNGKPSLRNHE